MMKTPILLLILLTIYVKGTDLLYNPGIIGLEPDSGINITSIKTVLTIEDTTCYFETIYKVSQNNTLFWGQFYANGLEKIETPLPFPLTSTIETLRQQFRANATTFLLEQRFKEHLLTYKNQYTISQTNIWSDIQSDSTFTIKGTLHLKPTKGLDPSSTKSNYSEIRHITQALLSNTYFEEMDFTENRKLVYLFDPISDTTEPTQVQLTVINKNSETISVHSAYTNREYLQYDIFDTLYSTQNVKPHSIKTFTYKENTPISSSISYTKQVETEWYEMFSIGGPLLGIGTTKASSDYFAAWESMVAPPYSWMAFLGSVGVRGDWKEAPQLELGVGISLMAVLNPRLLYLPKKEEFDWAIGIHMPLPILGFEIRENGGFLVLSF